MLCSRPNTQIIIQNLLQILLTFTVQISIRHMSNLMLFVTFTECAEGTHFLIYQVIKNIELPVTFLHRKFCFNFISFFEIDTTKCLLTWSRNLARKGRNSLLGNEDEPIFRG